MVKLGTVQKPSGLAAASTMRQLVSQLYSVLAAGGKGEEEGASEAKTHPFLYHLMEYGWTSHKWYVSTHSKWIVIHPF